MAVSSEKIRLGSCDVTYNAVDLGATKGGVDVEISTEKYTVTSDQTGETPLKDIITGTTVTVTVPMAETDLQKLKQMLPQSVMTPASGSVPTGRTVGGSSTYDVGDRTITTTGTGGGTFVVGQVVKFEGHRTSYTVKAVNGAVITVDPVSGGSGLEAPVEQAETITATASAGGVEIHTGVNIDLFNHAHLLKLHPHGLPVGNTEQDFTVYKAAPTANFSFKYELAGERIYEVEFSAYPDPANNNRIAAFGATA